MRTTLSAALNAARYILWVDETEPPPPATVPVAFNDTATTAVDAPVTVNVLANDTHSGGDVLTIVSVAVPSAQGTASHSGPNVTFTPALGFEGDATITYVVEDESGDQDEGILTVTVTSDPQPVANPNTATTAEDTPVTVNVLANDTHPEGDTLTIVSATVTSGSGAASFDGPNITFTPAANWNGTATVSYVIEDENGDTDTSTLTVTVTPATDNPIPASDTGTTSEGIAVDIDVLSNDTDPDGGTLTLVSCAVTNPAHGTAAVVSGMVRFTPASGFTGDAALTYVVQNSGGATATGNIIVTVNDVPDVDADLFNDPASPYYTRQVNGSTTAFTATGSAHWSEKEGLGGPATITGTEWRVTVNATRGTVRLTGSSLTLTNGKSRVRWRCKPVDNPLTKLYVGFDVSAMTGNFFVAFDITEDATADAARVIGATSHITNAGITKHPTNGWWYVRFDVDVTGWADRGGSLNLYMLDNPTVDLLTTRTPFFLIRCENLTIETV